MRTKLLWPTWCVFVNTPAMSLHSATISRTMRWLASLSVMSIPVIATPSTSTSTPCTANSTQVTIFHSLSTSIKLHVLCRKLLPYTVHNAAPTMAPLPLARLTLLVALVLLINDDLIAAPTEFTNWPRMAIQPVSRILILTTSFTASIPNKLAHLVHATFAILQHIRPVIAPTLFKLSAKSLFSLSTLKCAHKSCNNSAPTNTVVIQRAQHRRTC
jgi:hypothetical protein